MRENTQKENTTPIEKVRQFETEFYLNARKDNENFIFKKG